LFFCLFFQSQRSRAGAFRVRICGIESERWFNGLQASAEQNCFLCGRPSIEKVDSKKKEFRTLSMQCLSILRDLELDGISEVIRSQTKLRAKWFGRFFSKLRTWKSVLFLRSPFPHLSQLIPFRLKNIHLIEVHSSIKFTADMNQTGFGKLLLPRNRCWDETAILFLLAYLEDVWMSREILRQDHGKQVAKASDQNVIQSRGDSGLIVLWVIRNRKSSFSEEDVLKSPPINQLLSLR
jgi:hypothetical protein